MRYKSKMKILVAGAEGQVGREFVELARQPSQRHNRNELEVIAFGRKELDITRSDQILNVFEKHKPDLIVNAAAYTAVDKAEDDRDAAFAVNCTGPRNLAVVCEQLKIPLIHISTDYVFDGSKGSPYNEDDSPNPLSVYGESKLAGEEAIRENLEHHYILRTSWVFGKYGSNFVKTMWRLAKNQPIIKVVDDQFGSPTSASQIAETLLAITCRGLGPSSMPPGVYHFGGLPYVSWYEFALEILSDLVPQDDFQINSVEAIPSSEYPTKAPRPKNSRLNNHKLELALGALENTDWRRYLHMLKQVL